MSFMADPLWFKDAIVYELHLKAFFDANNDGIGDFAGLIAKLDYLEELGVNTIWLLPFYPSPMRDDGYDIADYHNVHPMYGERDDVKRLIEALHQREMRVITELVINHPSDQHPWFQAARAAPAGSAKRDFYVWSDSKLKYPGARIIFTDSEDSNWTWDDAAGAYYWHRFFSHQPDLNFDNPEVVKAIIHAMRFWLDMGVDGLRLDAIPYLIERDGGNCENLAETHAVIKQMRAVVDEHYQGRMFLAEANQWPEDVLEYFGDGDECHMAYHFPLMPRMYMALAQEDRFPMVDILNQTPPIPDNCQWALFLRNHDELTLEMVTDRERDYMYKVYASDPRMRVNVGIRRRLASLLDNDLDKVKLLNFLLMTLPGTPILYYGDEIGMGDNIYLGDRNGVRTPMQWSPDRNAGFSRADPQRLYLPPIMDPVHGYQAVNVEAQTRHPSSLLNWMRRLIAARRGHPAFGRGTLKLLAPGNRKVFAYLRAYQDQTLLCVANLSHSPQPVELDLREHSGRVPVELSSRNAFPPIGELPYLLTLPRFGYYWFELSQAAPPPTWHEDLPPLESVPVLVLTEPRGFFQHKKVEMPGYEELIAADAKRSLEDVLLPRYLAQQRWFAGKFVTHARIDFQPLGAWQSEHGRWLFACCRVGLAGGEAQTYSLPLALRWGEPESLPPEHLPRVLGRVRRKATPGLLLEAQAETAFCRDVVDGIGKYLKLALPGGRLKFTPTRAYPDWVSAPADWPVAYPTLEQSNTTVMLGDKLVLKLFRKIAPGLNPEWEMGRFLTEHTWFHQVAPVLGALEWAPEQGEPTLLAILQGYVENQGNAWEYTQSYLARFLENRQAARDTGGATPETSPHAAYCAQMRLLGQRTGELHQALAVPSIDESFGSEPLAEGEAEAWSARVRLDVAGSLDMLGAALPRLAEPERDLARALLERRSVLEALASAPLPERLRLIKTRYHGDYHLGQVLVSGNDFVIIDFEGEPARTLAERRRKGSPLRDVAGMLRSFDYAAAAAGCRPQGESQAACAVIAQLIESWRREVKTAFLEGWRAGIGGCAVCPRDPEQADALIRLFVLEKALYELRYELENRPHWLAIPLKGVMELMEKAS
ncbi:MAG: maltose alpha-D-glucosyltransferase [Pseudomonadota bacterium]|nr:maltose alpha-D-glucosyltransferase [Pseudomonadota bacterium]